MSCVFCFKQPSHTSVSYLLVCHQVLCNALVPAVLAVVYGVLVGCVDVPLGPLPNLEVWRCEALTAIMGGYLVGHTGRENFVFKLHL
jgi:hypothetical protein